MVQVAQVVAPLLLLFGTFTLGTLPIWLVRKLQTSTTGPKVLSFLVCLGGGVLFATSFLHLIPEVREGFEGTSERYPLTEAVVCFGFFAVYLVEEVVHSCLKHSHGVMDHGHAHSPAVITCGNEQSDTKPTIESPPLEVTTSHSKREPALNDVTISGLLIVAALSFHSIFEGLSLGLQHSEKDTWLMFLAIAMHKFVIAFVVGFDLSASKVRPKVVIIYMGIFALMSPLGSLVGVVTSSNFQGTAVAVLNGIAAGTLIYVTFFEVLQRQRNVRLSGLMQLFAVVLGFALMLILVIVLPHDHDHEEEQGHSHAHS